MTFPFETLGSTSLFNPTRFTLGLEQAPLQPVIPLADAEPIGGTFEEVRRPPLTLEEVSKQRRELAAARDADLGTNAVRGELEAKLNDNRVEEQQLGNARLIHDQATGALSVQGTDEAEEIKVARAQDDSVSVERRTIDPDGSFGPTAKAVFKPGMVKSARVDAGGGDDRVESNFNGAQVDGGADNNRISNRANDAVIAGGSGTAQIDSAGNGNHIVAGGQGGQVRLEGNNNEVQTANGAPDRVQIAGQNNRVLRDKDDRVVYAAANAEVPPDTKPPTPAAKPQTREEKLGDARLRFDPATGHLDVEGSDEGEILSATRHPDGGVLIGRAGFDKDGRQLQAESRRFEQGQVKSLRIAGNGGNDRIDNEIDGAVLEGGAGNDWIRNRANGATLDGGAGNSLLESTGNDNRIIGGSGDNAVKVAGDRNQLVAPGDAAIIQGNDNRIYADGRRTRGVAIGERNQLVEGPAPTTAPKWRDSGPARGPAQPFRSEGEWLPEASRSLAGVETSDRGNLSRPRGTSSYAPGPSLGNVLSRGGMLARGDSGEGVRGMQSMLNVLGVQPPLDEDGLFGPKTEAALRNFQRGLGGSDPAGACGRETLAPMLRQAEVKRSEGTGPASNAASNAAPASQTPDPQRSRPSTPSVEAAPQDPVPPMKSAGPPRDVSEMVGWAQDSVGKPYVFGSNDCGTMVRDYIEHFGLEPGPGSDNHQMLPEPLDFYGAFDASSGRLKTMSGPNGSLGKNHQDIAPGMVFGIGELCNQSDCRALGHAPDGTKFNTMFSCSHSGIITKVIREGGRPDGAVTDFEFAEMHGSVKGGGPGMTFHNSFVEWANRPRNNASQFQHAFVYAPPGTSPTADTNATQASAQTVAGADRRRLIDRVWQREAGGTVEGLVEWDRTEVFPSLGAFHNTWDNPAAGPAGRKGGNSFNDFLKYAQARGVQLPPEALAQDGRILDRSPWSSKAEMDRDPARVNGLRRWLADPKVQDMQLAHAEDRLSKFARGLDPRSQEAYRNIIAAGAGDLLIDLVNFKGEGAVQGTLQRYQASGDVRRSVAEAAWQTLQATRNKADLATYGAGWKNRLNGYWAVG